MKLLLGIDVGTTNCKAMLVSPEGEVLAQASQAHETSNPGGGVAEQNAEDWWTGVQHCVREVLEKSAAQGVDVQAIGVSGQGCAVTLIDDSGRVIRPAVIWMDTRSEPQCARWRSSMGETILRINGKHPAPYNADPSLLWLLEHEPSSIEKAALSLTSTAFITQRLTGQAVMNRSDASILLAYDQTQAEWSEELISAFGLPRHLYPNLANSSDIIGRVTPEAARALGLEAGTPVVAGGEDTSSAALALGVLEPGQASLSLGTAGTIYAVSHKPVFNADLISFTHVISGLHLVGGSTNAVGAALSWATQLLGLDEVAELETLASGGLGIVKIKNRVIPQKHCQARKPRNLASCQPIQG